MDDHEIEGREQGRSQNNARDARGCGGLQARQGNKKYVKEKLLVGVVLGQPAVGGPRKGVEDAVLSRQPGDGEVIGGVGIKEGGDEDMKKAGDEKKDRHPRHSGSASLLLLHATPFLSVPPLHKMPFKTEVLHRRGPWRTIDAVEYATLEWVDWFNHRRLLEPIGKIPPAVLEQAYYRQLEESAMAA